MIQRAVFRIGMMGVLLWGVVPARADEPGIGNLSAEMWNWFIVDVWQNERTLLHIYADQRWAEGRGSYLQIVSPRVTHRILPALDVGLGMSVLHIDPELGDTFIQLRPELELNPRYSFGEHWSLHNRNRLEARWNDFGGGPRWRTRHRLQLTRKVESMGPMRSWYLNNEWFGDLQQVRYSENRAVPLGVSFQITEKMTFDLFYMVRSTHLVDTWEHDHIAGTFLRVKL